MTSKRYYLAVCKLFPTLSNYLEIPETGRLMFTVPTNTVRFKTLDELSAALGTEMIDICTDIERDCTSSFGFRAHCDFECWDVEFPERLKDVVETTRPYSGVSEF